jgi:hypothetical protein
MESGEGLPNKSSDRRTYSLRVPVAEHLAKGLAAHLDERSQMASGTDEGAVRSDSELGEKVLILFRHIDEARQEGRGKITVELGKRDLEQARFGFSTFMKLGPSRGRTETLLEDELFRTVQNTDLQRSLKGIAAKAVRFLRR